MADCKCDAQYSGNDEAEYRARGCPSCVCGIIKEGSEEGDIVHGIDPNLTMDEVFKNVAADQAKRATRRYLLWHDESDCWFEAIGEDDAMKSISEDGCVDVTDVPEHEAMFLKNKK